MTRLLRLPGTDIPRDLLNAVLRHDLASFIRKTATALDPGTPFLDTWHIHAIAWHLEQVRLGRIRRLIINMPPRSLKSVSASVAFPAFVLGHDPTKRIISVSYGQELSVHLANDFRAVVEAPWYREVFPPCACRARTARARSPPRAEAHGLPPPSAARSPGAAAISSLSTIL